MADDHSVTQDRQKIISILTAARIEKGISQQRLADMIGTNPYGISYENVCREVMGTKQRNQLRKLIGFRFMRHPSINLPEAHLQAIEKHLERRVTDLLSLPRAGSSSQT
jgi:hypothetical protein